MKLKISWLIFVTGIGVGLYFLGVAAYFYGLYLSQPENPVRHEYLMGVAIGSMFAWPSLVGASLGAYLLQEKIFRSIRLGTYVVCILASLVFLYYLVFG
ncbi:hypothetical protein [Neptunomonas phycophila]|uniref:hypothetical protein n=1 Tax=Neptunomonas phycophila TaxID=1572645 RepID=UPI001BE64E42|nr:hypothetical protein [Neptunomonas phycophila]MBT3145445.1 hypothetical protein [Neptunomonas phycophila]